MSVAVNPGQPGFPRYLNYSQLRAAHRIYQAGLSIHAVSELIYERFGYKTPHSCATCLRRGWGRLAFPVRTNAEAQQIRHVGATCSGCGIHVDERTRGCHNCNRRHYERMQSGAPYVPSSRYVTCSGCGCPAAERTPACASCTSRHCTWRARGRPFIPGTQEKPCVGCGCLPNERTSGCQRCAQRHWKRSKRGLVQQGVETTPSVSALGSGTDGDEAANPTERKAA